MRRRNPCTRGIRYPFVVQLFHKGKWAEVIGKSTCEEAVAYVMACVTHDRKDHRAARYRIRSNRKTVFEMDVSFPTITVTGGPAT